MEKFLSNFRDDLIKPENYLNPSEETRAKTLAGLKRLFSLYQKFAREDLRRLSNLGGFEPISTGPLRELYTDGLDSDQVWEQIQMLNEPVVQGLTPMADAIAKSFRRGKFQFLSKSVTSKRTRKSVRGRDNGTKDFGSSRTDSEDGEEEDFEGEEEEDSEGEEERKRALAKVGGRKSVVDDKFFKLSEMERFLEMAEKEEEGKRNGVVKSEEEDEDGEEDDEDGEEDEDVNYFKETPSGGEDRGEGGGGEVGGKGACYEDFFDPPLEDAGEGNKEKKVTFADGSDPESGGEEGGEGSGEEMEFGAGDIGEEEEELGWSSGEDKERFEFNPDSEDEDGDDEAGKILSKHEKKQLQMRKNIDVLEQVNLSEKAWQMSGESTAKTRPLNSLLEEDLSVDYASRPAPAITEETTWSLEDLIKQRIRDEAWDDVERRVKPPERPFDYSRSRPLDQEKSKMSLAEVYEQEYIKQTQEVGVDKEDERHAEIRRKMQSLFVKLDALSNFHFTPKPPKPEVEIVPSVPAIQMEEVAPVATSDAQLLAPEELQAKSRRPEVGSSEKTFTDKKRERRLKKKRKRLQITEKKQREKVVSKIRPGLGNKYSKKALEKKMKLKEEGELMDKSLRSSSKFFARLQDEVKDQVQNVKALGKTGTDNKRTTAQEYKL